MRHINGSYNTFKMLKKILLAISLIAMQAQAAQLQTQLQISNSQGPTGQDITTLMYNGKILHVADFAKQGNEESKRINYVKLDIRLQQGEYIFQINNAPQDMKIGTMLTTLMIISDLNSCRFFKAEVLLKALGIPHYPDLEPLDSLQGISQNDSLANHSINQFTPILVTDTNFMTYCLDEFNKWKRSATPRIQSAIATMRDTIESTNLVQKLNLCPPAASDSLILGSALTPTYDGAEIMRCYLGGAYIATFLNCANCLKDEPNRTKGYISVFYNSEPYYVRNIPLSYTFNDLGKIIVGCFSPNSQAKFKVMQGDVVLDLKTPLSEYNTTLNDQFTVVRA